MASKEEENKLECSLNINKNQERGFMNVYKKYDCVLNNKTEPFDRKIESIIEVWGKIAENNLSDSDIKYVTQIMDWAKLHALNIVLTAEWKDYKAKYEDDLLKEIEKVQTALLKVSSAYSTRCQKLADVVKNPWEGAILEKLLQTKDIEIGPEEIEFFCVETAYLVSYRLKKLCESHCEDLALNLVTAYMKCKKLSVTQNFNLNGNETQMWFIFDIYIALLYKFQQNPKIVTLLKELSLDEGLQLIKRFSKKQVKISKIWKHCHKIAILGAQVYLSRIIVAFSEDKKPMLENLIDCFITICTTETLMENFTTSIRRISQLADAAGLYVFCDVVHRKAGVKLKPFAIEMYIRALTTDLNNLERQKNDKEVDKVLDTTKRLAKAFCQLGDILEEHVKVTRECVLTAFSLEPTQERLRSIEDLGRKSGFEVLDTGQEWKCKLHPPVVNQDEVTWICSACGDWMCKPVLNAPMNTNIALNEALQADHLGISPQLCDDLAVCLSNPRYQLLSWLLPWEELHRICIMYSNDPERTKNIITELKFVDIDYSIFKDIKREPLEEYSGIERGYEQYLETELHDSGESMSEDSASQESRSYSLGSDGAGDTFSPAASQLQQQPTKTNPVTLKSLRMFRPSLKRPNNKPIEPGDMAPEKLYKANNGENHIKPQVNHSKPQVNHIKPQVNHTKPQVPYPNSCNSNSTVKSTNNAFNRISTTIYNGYTVRHDPEKKKPRILAIQYPPTSPKIQIVTPLNSINTAQINTVIQQQTGINLQNANPKQQINNIQPAKQFGANSIRPSTSTQQNNNSQSQNRPSGALQQSTGNTLPPVSSLKTSTNLLHAQLSGYTQQQNSVNNSTSGTNNLQLLISAANLQENQTNTTNYSNTQQTNISNPSTSGTNNIQLLISAADAQENRQTCYSTTNYINTQQNNISNAGGRNNMQTQITTNTQDNRQTGYTNYSNTQNMNNTLTSGKTNTQYQVASTNNIQLQILPQENQQTAYLTTNYTNTQQNNVNNVTASGRNNAQVKNTQENQQTGYSTLYYAAEQPNNINSTTTSGRNNIQLQNSTTNTQSGYATSYYTAAQQSNINNTTTSGRTNIQFQILQTNTQQNAFDHQNKLVSLLKMNNTAVSAVSTSTLQNDSQSTTQVTDSKNGLIATLPPIGGQVAINQLSQLKPTPIILNQSTLLKGLKIIQLQTPSSNGMPKSTKNVSDKRVTMQQPIVYANKRKMLPKAPCSTTVMAGIKGTNSNSRQIQLCSSMASNIPMVDLTKERVLDLNGPFHNHLVSQCNNENGLSDIIKSTVAIDAFICFKDSSKIKDLQKDIAQKESTHIVLENEENHQLFSDTIIISDSDSEMSIEDNNNSHFENANNLEDIPKSLTENNKAKLNKSDKYNGELKDCKESSADDKNVLNDCKNVNNPSKKEHSIYKDYCNIKKKLFIILHHLPSEVSSEDDSNKMPNMIPLNLNSYNGTINTLDSKLLTNKRSSTSFRCNNKRRKSIDTFIENISNDKAPKRVQNYKLSPLLDINPRVSDKIEETEIVKEGKKNDISPSRREEGLVKQVLAKVPGLNDFNLIKPASPEQVVNVVQQMSTGGTIAPTITGQSIQTNTQVSPHIQRIGQPKSENTQRSIPLTTVSNSTVTTIKPATSAPTTLINILSQQIVKPVQTIQTIKRRSTPPLINISPQILKKTTGQVVQKFVTTKDAQVTNIVKATKTLASEATIKNIATVVSTSSLNPPPGTILQFICKSSLPQFQQAFGKSVFTTTAESEPSKPKPGVAGNDNENKVTSSTKTAPSISRTTKESSSQVLSEDGEASNEESASPKSLSSGNSTSSAIETTTNNATSLSSVPRSNKSPPPLINKTVKHIPITNVIRSNSSATTAQPNLSSTTLEQLREFDMVFKQVKERSGGTPADEVQVETAEVPQQRISVTYINQGQKFTQISPVVVVSNATYSCLQSAVSPALSVTSQGSSSPCVTPVSTTPTLPKVASKSSKGKSVKYVTTNNSSSPSSSKTSPITKPPQKPQEDEHTTQRIFDILAEYAEQLRNSPDLNNKPAPRRRSNPPTNPSSHSKRKKSSSKSKTSQSSSMPSEADFDEQGTMESEDSSCGVVQISLSEEETPTQTVTTSEPVEPPPRTTTTRQLILTSAEPIRNGQTRNLIIADSSVGEALKMSKTAVLVPGNYIMPVSMVKGGQQIAVMSGGSKILATVPARSGGPNMLLFQSFLNQNRKGGAPALKYSTLQPISGISSTSITGVSAQPPVILSANSQTISTMTLQQPLTLKKVEDSGNGEPMVLKIDKPEPEPVVQIDSTNVDNNKKTDSKSENRVFFKRAVPALSQVIRKEELDVNIIEEDSINMDMNSDDKSDIKGREQSVLVSISTANGPMLSHTHPKYRKAPISSNNSNNKPFILNEEKNNSLQKSDKTKKLTQRLDKETLQLSHKRKQAALERELRLQKSLSEECEDLGVDEPSTSELFPEADLLFDSNHSPSFEQTNQELKRQIHVEIKNDIKQSKNNVTIFGDEDSNNTLRGDIFEYVDENSVEIEYECKDDENLTNGSAETVESTSDNTLLQNRASMSDVTLNSPISRSELYLDNTQPLLNKYKFQYCNRKKEIKKQKDSWNEVSILKNSDSTELDKDESDKCTNQRFSSVICENEQNDGGYKILRAEAISRSNSPNDETSCDHTDEDYKVHGVAIAKSDSFTDEERSCEDLTCDEDDSSTSARRSRKTIKKMCSCCNGSQGEPHKKRSAINPYLSVSHKKAFLNKRR